MAEVTLAEFADSIPGFAKFSHADLIRYFAFFIHEHRGRDVFAVSDLRGCYDALHIAEPASFQTFIRAMLERKPRQAIKVRDGNYKLEARQRAEIKGKVPAIRPQAVLVEKTLTELPARLSDFAERQYLEEALICYRNGALRAAVVMTWNLAYDRLCNWVFRNKLAEFNARFPIRYPGEKKFTPITTRGGFADWKESQVITVCSSAGIITADIERLFNEKLGIRNSAAHPSNRMIEQLPVEAYIVDLISNVVAVFP